MVKKSGRKAAHPENDPHHTSLTFQRNKNQQKREFNKRSGKADKCITSDISRKHENIPLGLAFSAGRVKAIGSSSKFVPIPLPPPSSPIAIANKCDNITDNNIDSDEEIEINYIWSLEELKIANMDE